MKRSDMRIANVLALKYSLLKICKEYNYLINDKDNYIKTLLAKGYDYDFILDVMWPQSVTYYNNKESQKGQYVIYEGPSGASFSKFLGMISENALKVYNGELDYHVDKNQLVREHPENRKKVFNDIANDVKRFEQMSYDEWEEFYDKKTGYYLTTQDENDQLKVFQTNDLDDPMLAYEKAGIKLVEFNDDQFVKILLNDSFKKAMKYKQDKIYG